MHIRNARCLCKTFFLEHEKCENIHILYHFDVKLFTIQPSYEYCVYRWLSSIKVTNSHYYFPR